MMKFMEPHIIKWYAQPLCFKNLDKVVIKNSHFESEHSFPVIAITYCEDVNTDNDWCKSKDETDEWLLRHPQFFPYQSTKVDADKFEYNLESDGLEAFPFIYDVLSYSFDSIEVKSSQRDDYLQWQDI